MPKDLAKHTLTLEYNNLEVVEELFSEMGEEIGCIIVEPVAGNMNCIPPKEGFLQGLRKICDEYGSVLIFDEVMTGFRVALGGAQEFYNVTPDLTALGKVIGGGLPVCCVWREERDYESNRSSWPCLSSWNTFWKPSFNGIWTCHVERSRV